MRQLAEDEGADAAEATALRFSSNGHAYLHPVPKKPNEGADLRCLIKSRVIVIANNHNH